jgi:hypothetical protein
MSPASLPKPLGGVRVLARTRLFAAGPSDPTALDADISEKVAGIDALGVDEWVAARES